jgi:predicted AlkP superfamily pyrophosphatase or phosphodiesterase
VLICVDQLRGDSIDRVRGRLGPDGFRYFLERGFEFRNAHYRHAATVTAVGHATLATGASPGTHGVVGNSWFDTSNNERVYCVQDPDSRVHDEVFRKRAGSSPANLLVPTIGDELVRQLGPNTRVFSVSIKDRSSILMAGRGGKAFWLSRSAGLFTTSDYYYAHDEVPQWVHDFRMEHPLTALAGTSWELLHDRSSYRLGRGDARATEVPPPGWTTTFPHILPDDHEKLVRCLRHSPMGDHYTLEFVEALLDGENLGGSDGIDMLAISFSATDNIGHAWGPNSLEYEDNLLQIDRTLGHLLAMLDERIGLDRITVALSSDHGVDAVPEFRRELCAVEETARQPSQCRVAA